MPALLFSFYFVEGEERLWRIFRQRGRESSRLRVGTKEMNYGIIDKPIHDAARNGKLKRVERILTGNPCQLEAMGEVLGCSLVAMRNI